VLERDRQTDAGGQQKAAGKAGGVSDDELVVKSVWKSAHAVEDWPGKVTIRRYSPFKKVKVEGEGKTVAEAWKNVADRIRAIWAQEA
jgi:hypothetical protein